MTLGNNKMKTISIPRKVTGLVLAMAMMAISHQSTAAEITGLTSTQTGANTAELRFSFDGMPVSPQGFYYEKDKNLILDFKSVSNSLPREVRNVQSGLVSSATAVESDGNTRVVLGLEPESKYTYRVEGNDLVLTVIKQATPGRPMVPVVASPIVDNTYQPAVHESPPVMNSESSEMVVRVNPLLTPNINSSYMNSESTYDGLSSVNFSGSGNGGNISIGLNNEAIPVDVSRQGNKIVMRMTGSTIPKHLLRRMNVNSSLISSIDASNRGNSGTVIINMKGDFEYQAYQSGRQLNISVTSPKMLTEPTLEEKTYSGEPLSMEFQDVPVRNVLDILAQFTEMNIVASDSVSGNVTLRLMNVPWDQALDIIMSSKGLDKRENGNVIWVAPSKEIIDYENGKRQAFIDAQALDPLRTEYIRLSYANAKNVETLISNGNSGGGSGNNKESNTSNTSLLSARGTVTVDSRTNTLIVKDTSASIENIRALITKIDIPVKQVQIEARIVSASDTFSKDIGVEWGILSNGAAKNDTLLVGGSTQTIWDLKDFDINTTTVNGQSVSYPSYTISRPDNLNVKLGAANPAGSIAFSLLTMSDLMLDLELSAMQADNKGEVISSPKVLAMDKQTAKISSGTQIPYQSVSDEGTNVEFEEAALSLEVTPNITPDGKIGLALNITNGTPTIINNQIAISEDAISTNVLVEDGQTVVLGGVFKNTVSNGVRKVPFLGDLPYIGKAFRNDTRTNNKNELLIFITTRIVNDGVSNF